jgi:hypothetical protein
VTEKQKPPNRNCSEENTTILISKEGIVVLVHTPSGHLSCGHVSKPEQTLINGPQRPKMSSSYSAHACKLATKERVGHGLDYLN